MYSPICRTLTRRTSFREDFAKQNVGKKSKDKHDAKHFENYAIDM